MGKESIETREETQVQIVAPASLPLGFSKENDDADPLEASHRGRSRSRGRQGRGPTFASGVLNTVVNRKRLAASDRNPHHEGLEHIKAEALRERGIDVRKDRGRRRSSSSA